jgi:hypothetical protein
MHGRANLCERDSAIRDRKKFQVGTTAQYYAAGRIQSRDSHRKQLVTEKQLRDTQAFVFSEGTMQ